MARLPDLGAILFTAFGGTPVESPPTDPGLLVLAETGGDECEWTIDPMETGSYWRPDLVVVQEFLAAMQASPSFRGIVRTPAAVQQWCRERLAA